MPPPGEVLPAELLETLECPRCRDELEVTGCNLHCRGCRHMYRVVDGVPVFADDADIAGTDFEINKRKWKEYWRQFDWEGQEAKYQEFNTRHIERHLGEVRPGANFLELGGGASFLSFALAAKGLKVFSVDLDLDVLLTARRQFLHRRCPAHFVQCDINHLPFKEKIFSGSAGIGVIEHSRRIVPLMRGLRRITRDGGFTFQTVPYLSLLTLLHNSMRFGTAPNIRGVRWLVEFVHVKLLQTRYMKYGYEQSFSYRFLRRAFGEAGFLGVDVGFYDYDQTLFRQNVLLSMIFRKLITLRVLRGTPFADIAYIRAVR